VGARDFLSSISVQNSTGVHPPYCIKDTGTDSGDKASGRGFEDRPPIEPEVNMNNAA
jgi:hypothetical protein